MSLQTFYKRHTIPLTLLLVLIGALLLSMLIVSQRTQTYQETVKTQLNAQVEQLQTLASAAAQNRAGSANGVTIQDCPTEQRTTFDGLLGRLDSGLQRSELLQLEQLFSACAHVQAERKAVVVAQLEREVSVLTSYVDQMSAITSTDAAPDYAIASWERLVEHESAQVTGFGELVIAQKSIIDTLLEGKAADSPEMLAILDTVKETQEALLFANTQATTLRAELGAQ